MKKLFAALILSVMSTSVFAVAVNQKGTISVMRVITSDHESSNSVQAIFQLSSGTPGCTWVNLSKDNKEYFSTLLTVKTTGQEVIVWYDDATCRATNIQF